MGARRERVGRVALAALVALTAASCAASDEPRPEPTTAPLPTVTTATSTTTALVVTTTATSTTASTTTTAPAPGSVDALLAGLAVRTQDATAPYDRDAFGGGWDYDPATGCNTRERVLIDESVIAAQVDDRCRTTVGRWRSLYDGRVTGDPADLQIDHVVPLADAWRSGADAWTPERREAFANDRTSPDTLLAVTGSTNESKGDSTPDEWLPPDEASWCTYAGMWVRVKAAWDLSVTAPERDRLAGLLAAC